MPVQVFKPEGIDNAGLLRLVRNAQAHWVDSSLTGLVRRTVKEEKEVVAVSRKKDRKVAVLPWTSPFELLEFAEQDRRSNTAMQGLLAALMGKLPRAAYVGSPDGESPWVVVAWANEFKRGDSLDDHDHVKSGVYRFGPQSGQRLPDNVWAAIYYPQAPKGAVLQFGDEKIEVETGTLLVFPAELKHRIPFYDVAQSRISIAFNVRPTE